MFIFMLSIIAFYATHIMHCAPAPSVKYK